MTRAVHQLIAAADLGDAITGFAFEVQTILRSEGFESEIFAPLELVPPDYRNTKILPLSACASSLRPDDIVIYHYSIGSAATDVYVNATCRKWICYHNITPEKYFRLFSPVLADQLRQGRATLQTLISMTELALGVSEYNRSELESLGARKSGVLPLVVPTDYLRTALNPAIRTRYRDGRTNILFVGRVAPNKRLEDLIQTFYYFHHTLNNKSRLILAGSPGGCGPYYAYLKALVAEAGLSDSVVFTGRIELPDLIAYYQSATAFLCLSQHEGFCLPLLEAMQFDVPVFALAEAAIPETLGGAGVLMHEPDFRKIAELMNEVLARPDLVQEIVAGQRRRLLAFDRSVLDATLLGFVKGG